MNSNENPTFSLLLRHSFKTLIYQLKAYRRVFKTFSLRPFCFKSRINHICWKDFIEENSDKDILILGASSSALEVNKFTGAKKPKNLLVIGTNWTTYLDIELDIFISAHLLMCCLADKALLRPKLIINPNKSGFNPGYGVYGVKRVNFGSDLNFLFQTDLLNCPPRLYTKQNVLFLMINLAINLNPKSVTFCGFENRMKEENTSYFFDNDSSIKHKIFSDIINLRDIELMGHSNGYVTTEILNILYSYTFPHQNQQGGRYKFRDHNMIKKLFHNRDVLISEFLNHAKNANRKLHRLGPTTQFYDLPESPLFNDLKTK